MSKGVEVKVGDVELQGEFKETECAETIYNLLPLKKDYQIWGDEFYFPIELNIELDETATTEVDIGTIGYWPPGKAVAVFFGPTPSSDGEKPVAASDVNVIGKIEDAEKLKDVKDVGRIKIEKI